MNVQAGTCDSLIVIPSITYIWWWNLMPFLARV